MIRCDAHYAHSRVQIRAYRDHPTILVKSTEMERLHLNESQTERAISAVLPVKDGQEYLEELLPTILGMLTEIDELIVINDGSSDQTQFILEKYQSADSRINLINTSGLGLVGALNLGINAAQNAWIARFDVDDKYMQERLHEQRKYLIEGVSVIFSDYHFISKSGKRLGAVYSGVLPIPTVLSLISSQRTAHPSAVINRERLLEAGGYQIEDFPAEDLALWLRMSQNGEMISAPMPLLRYTLSGTSISAQNREIQKAKKRDLIQSFSFWHILRANSVQNFVQTLNSYKKISHAPERILLHLRDLFLVEGPPGKKLQVFALVFKIGPFMSLKIFYAAIKMVALVLGRRLFRFIHR